MGEFLYGLKMFIIVESVHRGCISLNYKEINMDDEKARRDELVHLVRFALQGKREPFAYVDPVVGKPHGTRVRGLHSAIT